VQYGKDWIARFGSFTQLMEIIVLCSAILLVLTATFMMASTVRHTVVSRQDELEVLRLLGATHAYFQTPLIIEGVVQGICGSSLGILYLYSLFSWIKIRFSTPGFLDIFRFEFLAGSLTTAIIVSSVCLCTMASFISIRKFMRI